MKNSFVLKYLKRKKKRPNYNLQLGAKVCFIHSVFLSRYIYTSLQMHRVLPVPIQVRFLGQNSQGKKKSELSRIFCCCLTQPDL